MPIKSFLQAYSAVSHLGTKIALTLYHCLISKVYAALISLPETIEERRTSLFLWALLDMHVHQTETTSVSEYTYLNNFFS